MGLRWCLYGYEIKNDKYTVIHSESQIVRMMFDLYITGKTFSEIADYLTSSDVAYYKDKKIWNKAMVSRIIGNRYYIGNEDYPAIISEEVFCKAEGRRNQRGGKREKDSKELSFIKQHIYCDSYKAKIRRIGKYTNREKWVCDNKRKCSVYVDDDYLFSSIVSMLNLVIENTDLLSHKKYNKEEYVPSIEVVRDENEFRFMMEQIDVKFKAAKKIIYTCATDKFKALSDNCYENVTQALVDYFVDIRKINAISYELLKDTVEKIFVGANGSISMIFVNNKRLNYLKGVADDAGNKNCY